MTYAKRWGNIARLALVATTLAACSAGEPSSPSDALGRPSGSPGQGPSPGRPPVGPTKGEGTDGSEPTQDGASQGPPPAPPAPPRNPYENAAFYVNPDFTKNVDESTAKAPEDAALLRKTRLFPTAVWLDKMAKVPTVTRHLNEARTQRGRDPNGKPVVTTFVVYNLPERDCNAMASAGELFLKDGGEAKYRKYINDIANQFRKFPDQTIVAVIEPDSLPNLTTNMDNPKCRNAERAYRDGVAYAIKTLSAPNVYLYVDAAHSGWLGWDKNRQNIANLFREVLDAAGGSDKIRGFATNVANYTPLSVEKSEGLGEDNPCQDEATYVTKLAEALAAVGIRDKRFIIDTSRNGVRRTRAVWGNWCNIDRAGFGERPRADPSPGIDAYFYVKVPGESDGTSDRSAARYDAKCSSPDAVRMPAPEAGDWFHSYYVMLARNAVPRL